MRVSKFEFGKYAQGRTRVEYFPPTPYSETKNDRFEVTVFRALIFIDEVVTLWPTSQPSSLILIIIQGLLLIITSIEVQIILKNALILCQQVKDQALGYLRTCIFWVYRLYRIVYTVRFVGYVDVKCIKNANISFNTVYLFLTRLKIFLWRLSEVPIGKIAWSWSNTQDLRWCQLWFQSFEIISGFMAEQWQMRVSHND